ncbi:hypothetical protein Hanom_Chr16g01425481 [Helianthus anomalus]
MMYVDCNLPNPLPFIFLFRIWNKRGIMVRLEESYFMVICILLGAFLASHQCNLHSFIGRKNLTDIEAFGVAIASPIECVKQCTRYQVLREYCCCRNNIHLCASDKQVCEDKCKK